MYARTKISIFIKVIVKLFKKDTLYTMDNKYLIV